MGREKARKERERERGHWDPRPFQATIKMALLFPCLPLCLPLYPIYFSLFITILKNSRPLVLYTNNSFHRRSLWLVAKHCCMFNNKTQSRLTFSFSRKINSQLENITIHDTKKLINFINQQFFTSISSIHTSIVLKICGKNKSFLL